MVSRVHDRESFSAIDGLILDLNLQPTFDQLAELAVLGWIIRINVEQELFIVRVKKRMSTQGACVRPDG